MVKRFWVPVTRHQKFTQYGTRLLGSRAWPRATKKGIKSFWFDFLPWDEIVTAEIVIPTDLPYLKIETKTQIFLLRQKIVGLPMYFWCVDDFVNHVLALAPENSPVRKCLDQRIK